MLEQIDIKAERIALGMSQSSFAKNIGVDQSTVSMWEKHGLPKNAMIRESLERRLAALREQAA